MEWKRTTRTTTKTDLVRIASQAAGVSPKQARATINAMLTAIVGAVSAGGRVEIRRFGIFQQRRVKARIMEGTTTFGGKPVRSNGSIKLGFKVGASYRTDLHVTGQ